MLFLSPSGLSCAHRCRPFPRGIPYPDSQYTDFPFEQVPDRPPDSLSLSHSGSAFRLPPMNVPVPTVIVEIGMFRRALRSRVSRDSVDLGEVRIRSADAAAGYERCV